jgi:hypothetical protein
MWAEKQAGLNVADDPEVKAVFNSIRDALSKSPLHFENTLVKHRQGFGPLNVTMGFQSRANGTIEMDWRVPPHLVEKLHGRTAAGNPQSKWAAKKAQELWQGKDVSPLGVPYPKSKYDTISPRPFSWATPAKGIRNTFPEPWRVAKRDAAEQWLKKMFKHQDLYTDHHSLWRGRQAIWVGLRNNRDKSAHFTRIGLMAKELRRAGYPIKLGDNNTHILLLDDLRRDALKGRMASSKPVVQPSSGADVRMTLRLDLASEVDAVVKDANRLAKALNSTLTYSKDDVKINYYKGRAQLYVPVQLNRADFAGPLRAAMDELGIKPGPGFR